MQQHRLPASWLAQYLYTTPHDLEERGVTVQVVRIPDKMLDWLQGWDGVGVGPSGQEIQYLKGRALTVRPTLTLLGHDEGRLLPSTEADEFKTPPRPHLAQTSEELGIVHVDEDQSDALPPADELYGMYEQERIRT